MALTFQASRKHSMSAALKRGFLTLLLFSLCFNSAGARDLTYQYRENLVRAAFLYNLAKFVSWSADSSPRQPPPLVLSVLDPAMGEKVLASIDGRFVRGRPLKVRAISDIREIGDSNILFVGGSHAAEVDTILEYLKGKHVLSISDIEGFAAKGGAVEFFKVNQKIRFGVNLQAVRRAGLVISSEVLRLASFVRGAGGGDR